MLKLSFDKYCIHTTSPAVRTYLHSPVSEQLDPIVSRLGIDTAGLLGVSHLFPPIMHPEPVSDRLIRSSTPFTNTDQHLHWHPTRLECSSSSPASCTRGLHPNHRRSTTPACEHCRRARWEASYSFLYAIEVRAAVGTYRSPNSAKGKWRKVGRGELAQGRHEVDQDRSFGHVWKLAGDYDQRGR